MHFCRRKCGSTDPRARVRATVSVRDRVRVRVRDRVMVKFTWKCGSADPHILAVPAW